MPLTALLTGLGLAAAAGFNAWAVLLLFHGLYSLLPQEFPGAAAALLGSKTSSASRSFSFSRSS